jgi:TIR domain
MLSYRIWVDMVAYEYDIFLSYRRTDTVGRWVRNHLLPRLGLRLNEASPVSVRISCDKQIESGARWPEELKSRIRQSGLLLMVCSADYFRSDWCVAEWESFREREKQLGLIGPGRTQGLIYPIRYADGDHYHHDLQVTQCNMDFSSLNYPDEVFSRCPEYIQFDRLVQDMARELISLLKRLPAWQDNFPIVLGETMPPAQHVRSIL